MNHNYKLIHDQDQLQKFVDFLPDLKENEGYFLILIARKKWNPESEIPSALKLKRETVSKEKIIQTIRQWEVADNVYSYDGKPVPNQNLGIYIGYNPKDQYAACFTLINKCLENIKSNRKGINVKSMANDVIQGSNGTHNFMDIDVDIKEGEDYLEVARFIKSIIDEKLLTFVKTNGGFHCLVRLGEGLSKTWHPQIKAHKFKSDLNIMSNDLMPLVGCNQGKFTPYFLSV